MIAIASSPIIHANNSRSDLDLHLNTWVFAVDLSSIKTPAMSSWAAKDGYQSTFWDVISSLRYFWCLFAFSRPVQHYLEWSERIFVVASGRRNICHLWDRCQNKHAIVEKRLSLGRFLLHTSDHERFLFYMKHCSCWLYCHQVHMPLTHRICWWCPCDGRISRRTSLTAAATRCYGTQYGPSFRF